MRLPSLTPLAAILAVAVSLLIFAPAKAQYTLTGLDVSVVINFDGLGSNPSQQGVLSGGSQGEQFELNALANWWVVRATGSAPTWPLFNGSNDGNKSNAAVYSFGIGSNSNRMLGCLANSQTVPRFATSFINNTGNPVVALSVQYLGAQWRTGNNALTEVLHVDYRIGGSTSDILSGTWVPVPSLDFTELNPTATSIIALDGYQTANQTTISATISGINVPVGERIWLRWRDTQDANGNSAFAIDNLIVAATSGTAIEAAAGQPITHLTCYPNPTTNGIAWIAFSLAKTDQITIHLLSLSGALQKVLSSQHTYEAGTHCLPLDLRSVAAANYLVAVSTESGLKYTQLVVVD